MGSEVKSMKYVCSILHDLKRGTRPVEVTEEIIRDVEFIYHELKEKGSVTL
jgi:hypothetical protein